MRLLEPSRDLVEDAHELGKLVGRDRRLGRFALRLRVHVTVGKKEKEREGRRGEEGEGERGRKGGRGRRKKRGGGGRKKGKRERGKEREGVSCFLESERSLNW